MGPGERVWHETRRAFLGQTLGLGALALSSLLQEDEARAVASKPRTKGLSGLPGLPHFRPKVKRVIFLYMSGGPSHLETFDHKPGLTAMDGKPMPTSYTKG